MVRESSKRGRKALQEGPKSDKSGPFPGQECAKIPFGYSPGGRDRNKGPSLRDPPGSSEHLGKPPKSPPRTSEAPPMGRMRRRSVYACVYVEWPSAHAPTVRGLWFRASWMLFGNSWLVSRAPLGCSFGASWGPFWGLLGPLLGLLGASWASRSLLGPSRGHLAPSRATLGPSWAVLGAVSGPTWAVLGPSWGVWAPSWSALEASWAPPGQAWGSLGSLLDRLQSRESSKGAYAHNVRFPIGI